MQNTIFSIINIILYLNRICILIVHAWFLSSSDSTGPAKQLEELRMIYPNHWGAINEQKIIRDENDIEALLNEVGDELLK